MNTQEIIKRNSFIDWFSYQYQRVISVVKNTMERFRMKTYTYIDNSNFFVEGQRLSAVKKGMAKNIYDAMNNDIFDHSWQPDYGKLHDVVCSYGKEVGFAKMWGSVPPYDTFWKKREQEGFKVEFF